MPLVIQQSDFDWRAWENEAVAYNRLSGDTHHLRSPCGIILTAAKQYAPISLHNLCEIVHRHAPTGSNLLIDEIVEIIDTLLALGILAETDAEDR